MTESEVKAFVRSKREGTITECYGPSLVGTIEVWEVWVIENGNFETRFVASPKNGRTRYFSQFQQFCGFVSDRTSETRRKGDEQKLRMLQAKREHRIRIISLTSASITFLVCVGALVFCLINEVNADLRYVALLGGMIASGSSMFYGFWILPKV